jgi:hypothetical protein
MASKAPASNGDDPPVLGGIWLGELHGAPFFLNIHRVRGDLVNATAELRVGDDFVRMNLRGKWTPAERRLDFVDSHNGCALTATLNDGTLNGTARLGSAADPEPWIVTRKQ